MGQHRAWTGDPATDAVIAREIRYGQTRWTEVWLAAVMFFIGVTLLVPMPTMVGPQWRVIKLFVTEEHAGMIAVAVGGFRLIALWINGRWRETPLIRVAGCMAGVAFWSAATYGFVDAIPPLSLAVVMYPIFAIAEMHSSSRAGGDVIASNSLGVRDWIARRFPLGSK